MYKKLKLDFNIPEELERDIDALVEAANNGITFTLSDCQRTEIMCDLNWCKREGKLTDDQITLLREYYQKGGLFQK